VQTARRLARCRGGQDGVELVEQRLQPCRQRGDGGEGGEVVHGDVPAATLDALPQAGAELGTALLVVPPEVVRDLGLADDAVHVQAAPEVGADLHLRHGLPERLHQLGKGLARHRLGVPPGRRPHERQAWR
jgi:hypothetical protein